MLAVPLNATRGVVLCHPHPLYGGTMDVPLIVATATALQDAGVATLRFNFRGTGRSEGDHDEGRGERDDARAAVAFLAERSGASDLALAGYSFGAMVALAAGAEDARVGRLVAIAPPIASFDLSFLVACRRPKLFIAGDRDAYCPIVGLERTLAAIAEPCELVRLPGIDHFFMGAESEVARHVVRFVAAQ
jgi:uncharacterized protein